LKKVTLESQSTVEKKVCGFFFNFFSHVNDEEEEKKQEEELKFRFCLRFGFYYLPSSKECLDSSSSSFETNTLCYFLWCNANKNVSATQNKAGQEWGKISAWVVVVVGQTVWKKATKYSI